MDILFINMMEERHASTKRAGFIVKILREEGHRVKYIGFNGPIETLGSLSSSQTMNIARYASITLHHIIKSCNYNYDAIYFQKLLPFFIPSLIIARCKNKLIIADVDDIDSEYQPNKVRKLIWHFSEVLSSKLVNLATTHNDILIYELNRRGIKNIIRLNQAVDLNIFVKSSPDYELLNKYGLNNKLVFVFSGTFNYGSALELPLILEAFNEVRKINGNAVLLLIMTKGPIESRIINKILEMSLSNHVRIARDIPHSNVPKYLSLADCGLIYMNNNMGNLTRFSMKLLEYLAIGLPVIGKLHGASLNDLGMFCYLVNNREELVNAMVNFSPGSLHFPKCKQYLLHNHTPHILREQLRRGLQNLKP
jgi:glycosyltransferase involved in cell wall biosynthesis